MQASLQSRILIAVAGWLAARRIGVQHGSGKVETKDSRWVPARVPDGFAERLRPQLDAYRKRLQILPARTRAFGAPPIYMTQINGNGRLLGGVLHQVEGSDGGTAFAELASEGSWRAAVFADLFADYVSPAEQPAAGGTLNGVTLPEDAAPADQQVFIQHYNNTADFTTIDFWESVYKRGDSIGMWNTDAYSYTKDTKYLYTSIPFFVGAVLVPILVPLVVGWYLLAFPASSTRAIVGGPFASSTELERLMQPIVFAAIGLYYLVGGLADIGYYLALKAFDDDDYGGLRLFASPEYSAGFINAILRAVVGAALVLGARGLSHVVSRLRQGA